MRLKVDEQADALYLSLSDAHAAQSDEVAPGIIVDFDEQGRAVGIEFLHLSKRTAPMDLRQLMFESVPMAA
jgi:uncharacterized protein YuzE